MMKLLVLLFVVAVTSQDIEEEQHNLFIVNQYENAVTSAVLKIIDDFFSKETSELSFTYSAIDDSSLHFMLETIEDILIKLNSNYLISLQHASNTANTFKKIHNIIYVDDYESFLDVIENVTPETFDFQGYHLIILSIYDRNTIKRIFEFLWSHYIVNVNIVTKEDEYSDEALMFTYFPYTRYFCEKVEPVLLNNYIIDVGFTRNAPHFPNKLANMHKCPMIVATVDIPPFIVIKDMPGGIKIFGLEGIMMIVLERRMNFTMKPMVVNDSYLWGQLYENGTSTGAIEKIMTGAANLTIGYYTSSPIRNLMMSASSIHYTSSLVWVIPPGRQLTSLEKLMKPFSPTLWSAVIIVFIVSFLIVSAIGWFTITIQNFVFGRNIRTPSLNIINVFFGGSLVQTPRRNFARTILCLFMLYCLIIRSSYQGALFKYMQMDSRSPVVETVRDMIHEEFHFYMLKNTYEHIANFPWISKR